MFEIIAALAVGIAVGKNWPKIKKVTGPYAKKATENIIRGYYGLVEASKTKRRSKK